MAFRAQIGGGCDTIGINVGSAEAVGERVRIEAGNIDKGRDA